MVAASAGKSVGNWAVELVVMKAAETVARMVDCWDESLVDWTADPMVGVKAVD